VGFPTSSDTGRGGEALAALAALGGEALGITLSWLELSDTTLMIVYDG